MSSKSNGAPPQKKLGMGVEGRSWVQDPMGACLKLPVKNVIQS